MWPMLLDMSRDDCKRILRRMELEAYCSIISAFRAQGDLTKDKKKLLLDLQQSLSISTERHRAEVRRAVNDEKLATIADHMSGPNTDSEWMIEGRRLIPLMPRLVPQTAFTVTANQMANLQAEKNAAMPNPSQTGNRDVGNSCSSPPTPVSGTVTKVTRPSSPNSNVVVLPSGMSIHIKGGLNTEEDEELPLLRKRRRSHSTDTPNVVSPSASTQTPRVTFVTTPSNIPGMSPMKITISKSPQGRPHTNTTVAQSQKVILVSSSGQAASSSILQKSITVPVVKTSSSLTGLANQSKASIIIPNSGSSSNGNFGNIVTVATSSVSTTVTSSSSAVSNSTMTFLTPTVSIQKPRGKTITKQRLPQSVQGQQKPGVVIPMGPHPVQPNPQSLQNLHVKPANKTSTIQIRQEGGMKIITQSYPGGSTSKILPKPMQTGSGTPVVVVSGGSSGSSSSPVTMVSRPLSSVGTKILNITQGGKVIQNSLGGRSTNVVTVNPKTLHLTAVKSAGGGTGKPNVIVVQKTQSRRTSAPGTPLGNTTRGTNILTASGDKKPEFKHIVVSNPSGLQRPYERKVIVTTPGQLEATRQRIRSEGLEGKQGTFLHELIQAASQQQQNEGGEAGGDVTINLDESTLAALTASSNVTESVQSRASTSSALPNNEWFEYDVGDDGNQTFQSSSLDAATLQALIDQSSNKPKVTVQRSASVDLSQLSDQLSSQQFYTIDQAMKILNNPERSETAAATESLLTSDDSQDSNSVTSSEPNVIIESSSAHSSQNELEQIARNLNLQGELDPQTGIFYTVTNAQGQTETRRISSIEPRVTVESTAGDITSASRTYDLLSSSLAQAQIDLEPYQFIEEDVLADKSHTTEATPAVDDKTITVTDASSRSSEQGMSSGTTTIRLKAGTSFIPIQELSGHASTINISKRQTSPATTTLQQLTESQGQEFSTTVSEEVTTTDYLSYPSALTEEVQVVLDPANLQTSTGEAVTVETTQTVDPAEVGLEEFVVMDSSQPGPSSSSESQSEFIITTDSSGTTKLIGKRKRKVGGVNIEDSPTQVHGGWTRACLGLIQKVMKYRGLNRDKGNLNASSWFLEPVDPADAPDYYSIIDNPMDFGTIKKKLETSVYGDYEDFHSDMLLVRDNCRLYNPPGSVVRRDCDEVFAYYMSEYERLLEKWQKTHISSPSAKKLKFDSPGK